MRPVLRRPHVEGVFSSSRSFGRGTGTPALDSTHAAARRGDQPVRRADHRGSDVPRCVLNRVRGHVPFAGTASRRAPEKSTNKRHRNEANHQSTDSDRAVNGAGSRRWRRNHDLKSRTRRGTTTPQVQAAALRPSGDLTSVPHLWSIRPCSTTHPSPNLINCALGAARGHGSGRRKTAKDNGDLFPMKIHAPRCALLHGCVYG